ncbi:MAG: tetratricopeptide repeat protein [Chloroflexota bacterium]|nr:tetratricopeptide repeat protein [Chloroflexota bacterium]
MGPSEEEISRILREKSKQAVALAMQGLWKEAAEANQVLLEIAPFDVEALNRLGRALTEQGNYSHAKETYLRVLELNPHNSIAKKNVERLSRLEESNVHKSDRHRATPQVFIKETGKAAEVSLIEVTTEDVLATLSPGDEVHLKVDQGCLLVQDTDGKHLGRVEPKHEHRLLRLIEGGNQYSTVVNNIGKQDMKVIIREIFRHPNQSAYPSFLPEKETAFQAAAHKRLLRYDLDDDEFEPERDDPTYGDDHEEVASDTGFHHEIAPGGGGFA